MLGISSDPPANLPVPGSVFSPPDTAAKPRASSRPQLSAQPANNALLHRRHFHPRIIRIPIFIRTNNFSDRKWIVFKLRQTLINSDAPSSRKVNKAGLHNLLSPPQTIQPHSKSIPAANRTRKPELASLYTTIVPHRSQQQASNEPGRAPSSLRSKASLASRFGSAFTAALPAAAPHAAGPLASVSRC